MASLFQRAPPLHLGLAVSGGSDSMALLHLAARWHDPRQTQLHAVTVDHGLRRDSAEEAEYVKTVAAQLGLCHTTCVWDGWDGHGNVQSAARNARYRLIHEALGQDVPVLTGHTRDDQAETILMRIKRGSGVDGLGGMTPDRRMPDGLRIMRPMLGMRRAELRDFLQALGVAWVEDPTNDDDHYDRVLMRQALPVLGDLGVTVDRLADFAGHMQRAAQVLTDTAARAFTEHGQQSALGLHLRRDGFLDLQVDTQTRLIAAAIMWTTNAAYRPRYHAVLRCLSDIGRGKTHTLQGAVIYVRGGQVHVMREYARCAAAIAPATIGTFWDNIWRVGDVSADVSIGALGPQGLAQLSPEVKKQAPSKALWPQPALFRRGELIAAPTLRSNDAKFIQDSRPKFIDFLKGH